MSGPPVQASRLPVQTSLRHNTFTGTPNADCAGGRVTSSGRWKVGASAWRPLRAACEGWSVKAVPLQPPR